jgi:hypothetical protein
MIEIGASTYACGFGDEFASGGSLLLLFAAAVEEFKEQTEENPGDEQGNGKEDAKEEVDIEHMDEGGAGDAYHTAELQAGVLSNESEQFFHCGYFNAVKGAWAIGRVTQIRPVRRRVASRHGAQRGERRGHRGQGE